MKNKKGGFIIWVLSALVVDYLLCLLYSVCFFEKSGIVVLPIDRPFAYFFRSLIIFANWGAILYIVFILFYFSIYFAYLSRMERINFGKTPLWVVILVAILFFQINESAIPIAYKRQQDNIYRYQYGLFFFNKGHENYYAALSANENKKSLLYKESFDNLERYLSYDPNCSLDKNYLEFETAKRADENQPVLNTKREVENELILLRQKEELLKPVVKVTPQMKFRTIDSANSFLDGGRKENNLYKCVRAYELFNSGYENNPADEEFKIGKNVAKAEVLKRSFIRSDIEYLFEKPLGTNIYAKVNVQSDLAGGSQSESEIFSASKMILNLGNYFFKEIKIDRLDEKGKLLFQIKAAYGILKEKELIFFSLGDSIEVSQINFAKKFYRNTSEEIGSTPFYVNQELLPYLGDEIVNYSYMSLFSVVKLIKMYQNEDPREAILWEDLLYRCLKFAFMIFVPLLFILLSSKLKPKTNRAPWPLIVFYPIAVLGIYTLYMLFHYFGHVMIAALLIQKGVVASLAIIGGISFGLTLLVISSYVVALKRGAI